MRKLIMKITASYFEKIQRKLSDYFPLIKFSERTIWHNGVGLKLSHFIKIRSKYNSTISRYYLFTKLDYII